MNTKVALVVIAVLAVLAIGLSFLRSTPMPAPTSTLNQNSAASTTSPVSPPQATGARSQSNFNIGTTSVEITRLFALFDSSSFTSTSPYPTITGTANVSKVGIIINNSENVGIVGTAEIPVKQGHWSYSCSVALPPGTYTLIAFVGKNVTETAKLTVKKP